MRVLVVLATVAFLIQPAWGADWALLREISAAGDDVTTRLEGAVTEMKQALGSQGCHRVAVAYWSESVPLKRLLVEVRCRDSKQDDSLAVLPVGDLR